MTEAPQAMKWAWGACRSRIEVSTRPTHTLDRSSNTLSSADQGEALSGARDEQVWPDGLLSYRGFLLTEWFIDRVQVWEPD